MEPSKKEQVIKDVKAQLMAMLEKNLDSKTRKQINQYLIELRSAIKNRDSLLHVIETLDTLGLVDVPDNLREIVNESIETIKDDYEFWKDFISDVTYYLFELEDKLSEKNGGCMTFIRKLKCK